MILFRHARSSLIFHFQLTNAGISKIKPRFQLGSPGNHSMFRNVKLANAMRHQNRMFRDIQEYLLNIMDKKAKNGAY